MRHPFLYFIPVLFCSFFIFPLFPTKKEGNNSCSHMHMQSKIGSAYSLIGEVMLAGITVLSRAIFN